MTMKMIKTNKPNVVFAVLIAILLIIPQFFIPVFGADREDAQPGGSYNVNDKYYDIKTSGAYTFSGTTDEKNITVDCSNSGEANPVVINLENINIDIEGDNEYPAINIESGYVQIVIKGENYLEGGHNTGAGTDDGCAAIRVDEDAVVEILGNGKLTAQGGGPARGAAGIGSDYDAGEDCGTIIIGKLSDSNNAPIIEAKGGGYQDQCDGAAGIGGGFDGTCGVIEDGIIKTYIEINNGTVTATGNGGAAGIGGGKAYASGSGGQGNNIIINGGTVTATGSDGAAGIGGSNAGSSGTGGDSRNITIHGGTVVAKGGSCAAGIGSGDGTDCYDLTIDGGTITATGGGSGAGIGTGREGYLNNLRINGGTMTANGGSNAAGIGAGNAKGTGDGGDTDGITITGGNIIATGGNAGSGIGGGDSGSVNGLVIDQAEENDLTIDAKGGENGAGIGSASNDSESKRLGPVTITLKGGKITATGGSGGAGIGSGGGSANNITIKGYGTINAKGYDDSSAIGAGDGETLGSEGDILIRGDGNTDSERLIIDGKTLSSNVNQNSGNDAAVIGSADGAAGDITIENSKITMERAYGSKGAAIGTGENHKAMPYAMGSITIKNCDITEGVGYYSQPGPTVGVGEGGGMDDILIENTVFSGGAIGGCFNGNEFFVESSVSSITLRNSDITATSGTGIKSAIGSGTFAGVGSIVIEDSEVHAEANAGAAIGSGGYDHDSAYDAFKWTGCECGDITISGSTVTALSHGSGAGIGGGWGTSVGNITIADSDVDSTSLDGGSAIGGGHAESCGDITISGSKVKADASKSDYSAGIGSSGDDDGGAFLWNSTCHSISISGSDVEVYGGKGSAAIGTAQESQFGHGSTIEIDDSAITAVGGEGGAGIGAGSDSWAGVGGEATDISISGKSKITSTGGSGGAGIGGGCSGGTDSISIDLEDTKRNSTNDDWEYYVKAYGGLGAAGIGAGSIYQESDKVAENGHDAGSVSISGGYVYAEGGKSKAGNLGPGAGIGGGAHGGNLNGFNVSGGFIEAHAGAPTYREGNADDIGSGGGNDTRPLAEDEDFNIIGGTVLGGLSDDPDEIVIDGGSVRHIADNAEKSNGTKVYRTQMKVWEAYDEPGGFNVTSDTSYGKNDIISDESSYIYLYLAESDHNGSEASFTRDNKSCDYFGTTDTSGNSWIKMGGQLTFDEPDECIVGEEFMLELKDDNISGHVEYTLTGDDISITEAGSTAPGSWVKLLATDRTEYTVNAKVKEGSFDSEIYWSAEGSYTDRVTMSKDEILSMEDPSKIYDGQPVKDPAVELKSHRTDKQIEYQYYDIAENLLQNTPKDAGSYFVKASVGADEEYASTESSLNPFTISKRDPYIDVSATKENADVMVMVYAFGAVDDPGSVSISINGGEKRTDDFELTSDGRYAAIFTFKEVAGDTKYSIVADYAETRNYKSDSDSCEYYNEKLQRTVSLDDISVEYGAADGKLTAILSEGQDSAGNTYTFEKVYDGFEKIGAESTAEITYTASDSNAAYVRYNNAGNAVIKVTVKNDAYNDAVAYAKIHVAKADLTVTSYAYYKDDHEKASITELTYGSIDNEKIIYDLSNDGLVGSDSFDDITLKSIKAVPLPETAYAGENKVAITRSYCRNYDINYEEGTIKVLPAVLYITVNDADGKYGFPGPEYSFKFGNDKGEHGLVPWDDEDDVIESVSVEGGKAYEDLRPGTYDIKVKTKDDVINYIFEENGMSTLTNGKLTIEKGDVSIGMTAYSKKYDGERISSEIAVNPVTGDGIDSKTMASPENAKVTYYELLDNGDRKKLWLAPKDSGRYLAEIIVEGNDYYNEAQNTVGFAILKVRPDVDTPEVSDIEMHDGLKLSEQKLPRGWEWTDGSRELSVGPVTAYAVYTPDDIRNYYKAVRSISFNVYENADDEPSNGPTDGGSGSDSGAGTGDEAPLAATAAVMIAALGGAAAVRFGRRRT